MQRRAQARRRRTDLRGATVGSEPECAMRITSIEATRIAYPDLIGKRTPPRPGPSRGDLNRQATPVRRYGTAPVGRRSWMASGGRGVGCVVRPEDGAGGL